MPESTLIRLTDWRASTQFSGDGGWILHTEQQTQSKKTIEDGGWRSCSRVDNRGSKQNFNKLWRIPNLFPRFLTPLRPSYSLRIGPSSACSSSSLTRQSHHHTLHMYLFPSLPFFTHKERKNESGFSFWFIVCFSVKLRCNGVDPDDHPVRSELVGFDCLFLVIWVYY